MGSGPCTAGTLASPLKPTGVLANVCGLRNCVGHWPALSCPPPFHFPSSSALAVSSPADYNLARCVEVQGKLGDNDRFPVEKVDATHKDQIVALAQKHGVSIIINACEPKFNEAIFDAAFDCGCNYMDMAMTLSLAHPEKPFELPHTKLGDYQFAAAKKWEEKGLLAVVGLGVEPGMSDVFARYAADNCGFKEIEEIGVRDGSNISVKGYEFAPNFSIWTCIEECLNPPVIFEQGKGWFTTEPFSEPEIFDFPGGIGPCEVVNVEHEEVMLIPRWIPQAKRVTFKYGLGNTFIGVLKTLHMLGLDKTEKVKVKGVEVSPRDVVAACLPDPAKLGDLMEGKTCAGTWVKGTDAEGKEKQVYIYQVCDNGECMKRWGCQAVVAQTAFNLVIGLELLNNGTWAGKGVLGPEAFPPVPFMERMESYGFPYGIKDMTPKAEAAAAATGGAGAM